MPDHVHAIITPAEVVSLEKAMQFIKGGSSFRLGKHMDGEDGDLAAWLHATSH